ncbi:MAG TPA: VOC family protein [Ktedonobacterales bacterium]|jgi:catechol 2,3-dioxygenase-like lactoylglutathione lyase family enzyme
MIDAVATLCIFVTDQDKAKAFYLDKLGFELRQDEPMGPDARWVAVAPPGARTEVILYKLDQNWEHYRPVLGKSQAITFNVTDMAALHADLKAKGVRITQEPDKQPWGTFMMILDQDDNALLLVEQPG